MYISSIKTHMYLWNAEHHGLPLSGSQRTVRKKPQNTPFYRKSYIVSTAFHNCMIRLQVTQRWKQKTSWIKYPKVRLFTFKAVAAKLFKFSAHNWPGGDSTERQTIPQENSCSLWISGITVTTTKILCPLHVKSGA